MVRQQPLFVERTDLQNTQTEAQWDLPAKWTHRGQNSVERGCWDVDSLAWGHNLFVAKPTSECSSQNMLQRNTSEHNPVRHQNLDLGLGLRSSTHNPDRNEMSDLVAEQASWMQCKQFLADEPTCSSLIHQGGLGTSDSDACLALKLGGETYSLSEENGFSNGKRCRISSPGSSQSPVCQVDDCRVDLSNAKDYHRRHRVCNVHAKANKALVGRLMQRFCQQCSRFHLLQEFDEGKRSCRRRLAGHNKRRRKIHTDATTFHSGDEGATSSAGVLGLINLLNQLQALRTINPPDSMVTDVEWLLRFLTKANPGLSQLSNTLMTGGRIPCANTEHYPSNSKSPFDQFSQLQASLTALENINPEALSITKSQTELRREEHSVLARQPGFGAAGTSSNQINQTEKNISHTFSGSADPFLQPIFQHEQSGMLKNGFPSIHIPITPSNTLSLSSSTPTKTVMPDADKWFKVVADGVNSGSYSLPQTKRLDGDSIIDICPEGAVYIKASANQMRPAINLKKLSPEQRRGHSDSASDNSHEEDMHERTERIVFKLCDRHPGEIPQNLRSQIYEWLYRRPTDMENYIRPGCIILCIFISMHELAWKELLKDLKLSLRRLLQIGNCAFWNIGQIFVQIGEENATIIDGEVYTSNSRALTNLPQLISVQPFAIVAGEETEIIVKGHNLTVLGTSIFCAYNGRYEAQEVLFRQSSEGSCVQSDDNALPPQEELSFIFREPLNGIGRCFIEAERSALGDFFPVIIAEYELCVEIRSLEKELEFTSTHINNCENADEAACKVICQSIGEAKYFLNELGWLFQLQHLQTSYLTPEVSSDTRFSFARFKHLLLYAVDHNWCAVLRKLLDLFCTTKWASIDSIVELGLLHEAVKRKCRPIVDMLLAYDVGLHDLPEADATESKIMNENTACRRQLLFRPNLSGPAGLTPLHLAASMQDAEELVDALTNDLAQVGVKAWNSCEDAAGQTPFAYALSRGYKSYINLVEAKRVKGCKFVESEHLTSCANSVTEYQSALPALSSMNGEHLGRCNVEMPVWMNFLPGRLLDPQLTSQRPCRLCRGQVLSKRIGGVKGPAFRPFLLSMVAIATVCVCVCLVLKGPPEVLFVTAPFIWDSVGWGYI